MIKVWHVFTSGMRQQDCKLDGQIEVVTHLDHLAEVEKLRAEYKEAMQILANYQGMELKLEQAEARLKKAVEVAKRIDDFTVHNRMKNCAHTGKLKDCECGLEIARAELAAIGEKKEGGK